VIGLLFGLLLFGTGKQSMRWFLIATASLLLGLAVSLSRSSYVMLICCLGLIFVLAGRSRMSRVIRASAVVILVGTLTVAVINYQGRTAPGAPAAVLAMFNVVGRFERWQILLYDTSTYSMIGQGIGSIQAAYAFGEQFVEEAHSFLFDLLLEVGVVGLVLFAWVCVAVFSQALRAIRVVGFEADRQELIVVVAILGGMLMAKSAAGGLWGMQVHDTYWWLLCGVVAGLSARQHRNIRSLTGCRRKNPARIV
jgi:O-antigen ligase